MKQNLNTKEKKKKKVRIRLKKKSGSSPKKVLTAEQQKKAQMRKKRKIQKAKRRFAVCAVLAVAVCGAAAVFKAPLFDIKEIVCVGQEKLLEEEIVKASGVKKGNNVFLTNIARVKQNLSQIPYVSECNARRIFPNKIKLWVREAKPVFAVKVKEKYAICDIGAKVLETTEKNEGGICELLLSEELEAAVGKTLISEDDPKLKKILECIGLLSDFDMLKSTNAVDFSDISDIVIYYDSRLKIRLGAASELDYKLKFAEKVIRENISDKEKATVDYTGDKLYVGPYDETADGGGDGEKEQTAEEDVNKTDKPATNSEE